MAFFGLEAITKIIDSIKNGISLGLVPLETRTKNPPLNLRNTTINRGVVNHITGITTTIMMMITRGMTPTGNIITKNTTLMTVPTV